MRSDWKPPGYSTVSVYLMVDDAQRVIDFLKQTFAATELRRFDGAERRISHAEVRMDDTVVMISEATGDYPAFPVWLHVYVPEVDATYKRALEAGGVPVEVPVQKQGDPDKRGGFKDPAGNTWWVSTRAG